MLRIVGSWLIGYIWIDTPYIWIDTPVAIRPVLFRNVKKVTSCTVFTMDFSQCLLVITLIFAVVGTIWHNWPKKSFIRPQLDYYFDYIIGKSTMGSILYRNPVLDSKSNHYQKERKRPCAYVLKLNYANWLT